MRVKAVLLLAALLGAGACASRPVRVSTGAAPASAVSLHVTNNTNQMINVYVSTDTSTQMLVGQVGANSTQILPVAGVNAGATATLRAATTDGTRRYTKSDVSLTSSVDWTVP